MSESFYYKASLSCLCCSVVNHTSPALILLSTLSLSLSLSVTHTHCPAVLPVLVSMVLAGMELYDDRISNEYSKEHTHTLF